MYYGIRRVRDLGLSLSGWLGITLLYFKDLFIHFKGRKLERGMQRHLSFAGLLLK